MSEQLITNTSPNNINVNKLGFFLDGWADIVEGMGSKADQVRNNVLSSLKGREMPDISLENKTGYISLVSKERRNYVVSDTFPGAHTVIYIAQHGKDLYASWRSWLEPKINWDLLKWFLIGSAILGLLTGGIRQGGGLFGPSETTFSLGGWLLATIGYIFFSGIILAIVGRVIKGAVTAYFFIEPNVFDAEDITAMNISVHKSVLRALDDAGIDASKLRLKQDYKAGRRGETV